MQTHTQVFCAGSNLLEWLLRTSLPQIYRQILQMNAGIFFLTNKNGQILRFIPHIWSQNAITTSLYPFRVWTEFLLCELCVLRLLLWLVLICIYIGCFVLFCPDLLFFTFSYCLSRTLSVTLNHGQLLQGLEAQK